MDKCVFCGWTRRCAYPSVRFFGIPKEPGIKRVQWLHAIGRREITPKDRVCSVHFRSGRPSSDPSHEDFVPHLFLNREPPPEVLHYLEELADIDTKRDSWEPEFKLLRGRKPSILQRKRKSTKSAIHAESEKCEGDSSLSPCASSLPRFDSPPLHPASPGSNVMTMTVPETGETKRVKVAQLDKAVAEAAGVKPGQTVIIKRQIRVIRRRKPIEENQSHSVQSVPTYRTMSGSSQMSNSVLMVQQRSLS